MKVFVTGASGRIGKILVKELLSTSHSVLGLSRSDAGVDQLRALGAEPLHGTLAELELLTQAAAKCDAVLHLAFNHDFTDYMGACASDRAAISAMGSALAHAGSNKTLIMTSGTMMLEKNKNVTEDDGIDQSNPFGAARGASEKVALDFVEKGVRVMVVRLPPVVHGLGSIGLVGIMLRAAMEKQQVAYIGTGANRWATVHCLDAVQVYRLALEKGKAGSVFHPIGEEGVTTKDIAEVVGKKLNKPIVSKTPEEGQGFFGFMSRAFMADSPASGPKTRAQLGWSAVNIGLLEDLEGNLLEEVMTSLK